MAAALASRALMGLDAEGVILSRENGPGDIGHGWKITSWAFDLPRLSLMQKYSLLFQLIEFPWKFSKVFFVFCSSFLKPHL